MKIKLTDYKLEKLMTVKGHSYLIGQLQNHLSNKYNGELHVYLKDSNEEKKLFDNCEIELEGEFIEGDFSSPHHLLNAYIVSCKIICDIPLEKLSIKDRLNATGLIHEFRDCFRKDKIRALEILKVLSVSEKYAEEILLRNSYILPFV